MNLCGGFAGKLETRIATQVADTPKRLRAVDHLARRSKKTEANSETERESQDEPIVDTSNAHGT